MWRSSPRSLTEKMPRKPVKRVQEGGRQRGEGGTKEREGDRERVRG